MQQRKAIFVVLGILLLSGCAALYDTLQKKDVQSWGVVEDRKAGTVTVSGLVGNSAKTVKKVTQEKNGKDMVLTIYIGLTGNMRDESGSFAITLDASDIDRVLFGKEKEVIWQRRTD